VFEVTLVAGEFVGGQGGEPVGRRVGGHGRVWVVM
jgi:hypothetical protein